ncbi:MAG TPA: hypothetical protein VJI13_06290 [Candidatus Norongarragalinales archaeon]|nr:hypothetical protein [Candidatus Norongarragalinales archaeon]
MVHKVSFAQLKQIGPSLQAPIQEPKKEFQVTPMFLPADISAKSGTGVIKVVTRQGFMNEKITHWVLYNSTRAATYISAVAALFLINVNILLAAVAGLAAGYFYGKYKFYYFYAIVQPRHRWLLEGT